MALTTRSIAKVTHVSRNGLWLLVGDEELLLPFEQFPWFREASIDQVTHVERPTEDHVYWPDLDIDLSIESIRKPASFPLMSRASELRFPLSFLRCAMKKSQEFMDFHIEHKGVRYNAHYIVSSGVVQVESLYGRAANLGTPTVPTRIPGVDSHILEAKRLFRDILESADSRGELHAK